MTNDTTTNKILIEIVGATNLSTLLPQPSSSSRGNHRGSSLNPLNTINNVSSSISNSVSSSIQSLSKLHNKPVSSSIKVLLNTDKIHKTNTIKNNNHPIWTVSSGSLFLVDVPSASVAVGGSSFSDIVTPTKKYTRKPSTNNTNSNILLFEIRDSSSILAVASGSTKKKSECIGTVRLDLSTIINKYCNNTNLAEERLEFQIVHDVYQAAREGILSWNDDDDDDEEDDDKDGRGDEAYEPIIQKNKGKSEEGGEDDKDKAILSLRFRHATQNDVTFMHITTW